MKLLLIEDDPEDVLLIEKALARQHLKAACAGSLKSGLGKLSQGDYDLVLLDLNLTDSSGLETVRKLCRRAPQIAVVVLTGLDDDALGKAAIDEGAQDYLVKGQLPDLSLRRLLLHAMERKNVYEKLRATNEALESSNRCLSDFAHYLSHDLKTPLTTILMHLQTLTAGGTASEVKNWMPQVLEITKNMLQLVDDLLDFSRMDLTQESAQELDSEAVVRQAVAHLERDLRARGAELSLEGPFPKVRGRASLILQILQNLIANALQNDDAVRPLIRIGGGTSEGEPLLWVADNGAGMAVEDARRLFSSPRVQPPASVRNRGLGLAICKRNVEIHRGRIWAESKKGKGATFYFTLPGGAPASETPQPP